MKKSLTSTSSLVYLTISSEVEREELKKTESEVDVEKMKVTGVVHKGLIVSNIYLRPKCNSFYCKHCATALREKGEKYWVCENEIDI